VWKYWAAPTSAQTDNKPANALTDAILADVSEGDVHLKDAASQVRERSRRRDLCLRLNGPRHWLARSVDTDACVTDDDVGNTTETALAYRSACATPRYKT
jgi:hypothetical protein